MALDTTTPQSRRTLLAGAAGAVAAAVGATIARAVPADAANGATVTVGGNHSGTTPTRITNTNNSGAAILGSNTNSSSDATGVQANAHSGKAVAARATGTGGQAVNAWAPNGYALVVQDGRVLMYNNSGIATIKAGKTSVTVAPEVPVTGNAFVLLTPKTGIGSRGLWFVNQPAKSRFIIKISAKRTSPTKVAWLLLEKA